MPFERGTIEATRGALPEPIVEAFVPITELGDPLFFVVLVALVYWLGDHERGGVLVGATLLVLGLTVWFKELLASPRPPVEVALVVDEGYGFPGGHAVGSVVVYGTIAAPYDVGPGRLRYAAAAVVAGLVSLSRFGLGVHYLGDVVAGVVLGCVVLLAVLRYRDRSPAAFFAVAAAGALAGAVLSRLTYEASLLLGGAVGALVCWPLVAAPPAAPRRATAACGAIALPIVVWLVYVGMAVLTAPLALAAATAVAMAVVLLTPHAAARIATPTGTAAATDTLY